VSSTAFFVLAEIGAPFEDRSYEAPEQWTDAFDAVAERLMELLALGEVKSRDGYKAGKGLVVKVESRGFPQNTPILGSGSLKENLKDSVVKALSDSTEKASGPLLNENRGQLFATVLLFDDLEAARAFVQSEHGENPLRRKDRDTPETKAVREAMENATNALPRDYEGRREGLAALLDTVRTEIAAALEPAINQQVSSMSQAAYEDKKTVAKWITSELRRFGLALSVDATDQPCLIMANSGGRPGIGRYAFYYTDDAGTRHDVFSPGTLPQLKLTLDELTRAPYGGRAGGSRR
jgi:hypothetical protein